MKCKPIKYLLVILLYLSCLGGNHTLAQKYLTTDSYARFYSDAPMEKIDAYTNKVQCAIDLKTGEIVFKIPMTTFTFRKPLMQKHFNEKYIESTTYPYARFQGKIIDLKTADLFNGEVQNVEVTGEMTIHGVTQNIRERGTLQIEGKQLVGKSVFFIRIADYKIKIPRIVFYSIAEEVEVTIEIRLKETQ